MPLKKVRTYCWTRMWLLVWLQLGIVTQFVSAANVMNYGADGNDYFQFTTPSLAFDKASGFTTLIAFAMHVDADGTLELGGGPVCQNGVYVGPTNWSLLVNALKTSPTTVTRYEVCIGGWLDTSYDNIKSLVNAQGTGTSSILYRNFLALKNAVPGIDAINDDDEKTYDVSSTVSFANLLGGLGYKFTTAPYTAQSFWVNVNNSITNGDAIYLQCYSGGAGNDPTQWNNAFGHGVKVIPGQESNSANPATFRSWYLATGTAGGFYYPDVVFASTDWSAAIIQANGSAPVAPAGLAATIGGNRVKLSWDVVPGAMAYNIKRATTSGGETTVASLSTANNSWPASNQYFDAAPSGSSTYYYKVSAVNTNGESANSVEVSAAAPTAAAWFKADALTGLSDGTGITLWPDSSGHGLTAIQTTLSQRPIFAANALNGLPVVRFDSASSQVISFNRPVQDDFTIFCVFRSSQGLGTGNQFADGAGLISGDVDGVANDFGACLFADGRVGAGAGNPDVSLNSLPGYNDGRPHLLTLRRVKNSGQLDLYVDGNLAGTAFGGTNSLNASAKLALGAPPTLTHFFAGDIAEVKIYGAALSDADRVTQETGLSQKWGLTSATTNLLAYENFNYPACSLLSGQFGGLGWSNGWVDVSGTASEPVNAGNLVAANHAPDGFDGFSGGNAALGNNNSRSGRWLDCSPAGNFAAAGYVNASGNIGAPGKTLYLSFLQQPSSSELFYEFEFHRGNLGDPGRIAGIGNDLANATTVNLRTPNAGQTPLALGDTNVNFYVVRIDYHGGNDDVYVYRNPTGFAEADNAPVLTMLGAGDLSFNGLSLAAYNNGVTVKHDEIRLGSTWAGVIGNPPNFLMPPVNQTVYVGANATFTTLVQSSQPFNYQWYRGTNALAGQTNASFTVVGAQLSDAGQYAVTISSVSGSRLTSAPATLTVQAISATISGPVSLPVGAGSNVVLHAVAGGTPPLNLQWYKDGTAIAGATNLTLALGDNGIFNAGQYALVAGNFYGSVTSSAVNVFPDIGGLLAYEGFNYGQSSSDIGGANGGFGWAGAWMNLTGGASQSSTNSLFAGTNAPANFDECSLNGALSIANASRKGRYLDCSATGTFAQHGYLDSNGNIGADGKTIYLSFLQQPSSTSLFYEFELKRGDLGDGGRIGGIGNDTGDTHAHLRIESPTGGTSTFYDLGPGSTNVNFYVLRIDYHTGNDTVTVYRNPTSLTEPANATVVVSNVGDLSFAGLSLGAFLNGVTVAHDEVRVGMTWNDVVGKTVSALQLMQHSNDVSSLLLAGSPNYTYQLEGATAVTGPWTNLGSVITPSLGVGQFTETNSTDPQRFYRAVNGPVTLAPPSTDTVLADFEQSTYGAWLTTGTAFGSSPAQGTLPGQQTVSGYQGSGLANSFNGGDSSTGTLTSPPFIITKSFLNFLIGGGNLPGQECLNLIISNMVVKTATGGNSETLTSQQWDVSAYLGQTARLQIVDSATGSWGHINVDQITLSDAAFPSLTRTMFLTNNLLNLPVKNGAAMKRVTVTVGGNPVRDFAIELADGAPDWWAFVDVSAFSNQLATISVDSLVPGSTGLSAIVQTNGIVGATNLYSETLRPQLHFSTKRGWLNDANGMFYYRGQYHLYYQHDPFNWDGSGQKWWGHAVSTDMFNWQEIQEGIYSHTYGDQVYSGSAVVDTNNTGGFKTGTNDVIVAAFYSTARGECIAYSNDGGLTFTDYANNPVVVHAGIGRDPHLFWYAPSNYWVMAVYDDAGGNGVQFYSTPDFHTWTFRSKIYNGFYECPDMFSLPVDGNTNNPLWLLCDASGGYQLGQFDGATFTPGTSKLSGNSGSGFYASQTFTSMAPGDKRIVRIAWAIIGTPGMPFNQMMYFPTELKLRTIAGNVQLCSTPIAEITNNAVNIYSWTNLTLTPGNNPLAGIRGKLFDVQAQFATNASPVITFTFQNVTVTYNASTQKISCNGDTQSLPAVNGSVRLEIIIDRDTIEIFGNNGQLYMPLPANNSTGNSLISLTCTGGNATFNSLTVNQLKSIWTGLSQ